MTGRRLELPEARVRRPDRTALALTWLLVLVAPQLLAGVYPWGMLSVAVAALLALAAALWASARTLPALEPLGAAMLLALAFTLLQALPLPCSWVAALAPDSALELERVHALLALPAPRMCALSRDPGATREEVVKGIAIVAAYAAARLLVSRGQRRAVVLAIASSGVLLALVTLAHTASGATKVFGTYAPVDIHEQGMIGPVLNLNSLGGVLALCVPMLVARALSVQGGAERIGLLMATLVASGTLLMTRSRGAVGALALGLLALGALTLWARYRRRRRSDAPTSDLDLRARLGRLAMPLAIVLALGLATLGTYQELAVEFRRGGLDKLQLVARSAAFAWEHPWLGVGRGAFAAAFAPTFRGPVRFDHPENLVVQWAAEWGVPVAAVLLLAVLHALARALRRGASWERDGALAGVCALGAQNMVDLGLELVGVAVLGAVALACATGERDATKAVSARTRAAMAGLAAAMAVTVALLAGPIHAGHLPYADRELRALLEGGDAGAFRARLRPALLAHPAAPVPTLLGAAEAVRRDGADALSWVNRSQALSPGWAQPHLYGAQWLWNHGHRAQALLELSVAGRLDVPASRHLACAIGARDPDGIVEIAPKTADAVLFLELAAQCVGRDSAAGRRLDEGQAALGSRAVAPRLRSLSRSLAAGQAQQVLSALGADPLLRASPGGLELELRALLALDRPQAALERLQAGGHSGAEPGDLLRLEIELLTALKDEAGLPPAFERLRGLSSTTAELTDAYRREATAWLALDRPASAFRAYGEAYRISGDTNVLREIASLAGRLGDSRHAREVHAQLCSLDPADAASCEASRALPAR